MMNPASAISPGRVCLSGCELILYEGSVRYGLASEVALLHVSLRFDHDRPTKEEETQGSEPTSSGSGSRPDPFTALF